MQAVNYLKRKSVTDLGTKSLTLEKKNKMEVIFALLLMTLGFVFGVIFGYHWRELKIIKKHDDEKLKNVKIFETK